MTRWIVAVAVGILVLCEMLLNVSAVFAGAFDQLSPGNQKAALSLFEAQRSNLPPGTRRLTLDEIAARKQAGEGWGRIFGGMKASGLVDAKNFGETVSSFNHRHHLSSSGAVTTAANRTVGTRHDAAASARAARTPEQRVSTGRGASHTSHAASAMAVQTHGRAGGSGASGHGHGK